MEKYIREFYTTSYPDDELGKVISKEATFEGLFETLDNYGNVYDYLNVYDSLVREHIFDKLSLIMDVDYDVIYQKWLSASNTTEKFNTTVWTKEEQEHIESFADAYNVDYMIAYILAETLGRDELYDGFVSSIEDSGNC